jgi:hypothetical protein
MTSKISKLMKAVRATTDAYNKLKQLFLSETNKWKILEKELMDALEKSKINENKLGAMLHETIEMLDESKKTSDESKKALDESKKALDESEKHNQLLKDESKKALDESKKALDESEKHNQLLKDELKTSQAHGKDLSNKLLKIREVIEN